MRFSVLGGGRWGVALACHLSRLGHEVLIYDRNVKVIELINRGEHPYIQEIRLERVRATENLEELKDFSDFIILALPVQVVREVIKNIDISRKVILSASKGLEIGTNKRVSEIIKEIYPSSEVMCISGPSFASEVSRGLPTALVLAGENLELMRELRSAIMSENLRIYLSTDLIGVELGGALKNVIAIACGISDGLGYGENARASLITRGLVEIVRIGVKLGAKKDTFYGLSGVGDLFLTASSPQSRNRTFGYLIGKGMSPEEALKSIGQVVEGMHTVIAVKDLSEKLNVHAPISEAVYRVVVKGEDLQKVVKDLLTRLPRDEFEE